MPILKCNFSKILITSLNSNNVLSLSVKYLLSKVSKYILPISLIHYQYVLFPLHINLKEHYNKLFLLVYKGFRLTKKLMK